MKALKMNDTAQTTLASILATISSFLIAHVSEIQAFITFSLTVVFLYYKIKEAKARAEIAENDKGKRH